MCECLNEEVERSPGWLNNIWFSEEAHYHLNEAVNNHNNVFWGEEPPEEESKTHLKGTKVTAWVAFKPQTWSSRTILVSRQACQDSESKASLTVKS